MLLKKWDEVPSMGDFFSNQHWLVIGIFAYIEDFRYLDFSVTKLLETRNLPFYMPPAAKPIAEDLYNYFTAVPLALIHVTLAGKDAQNRLT